MSNGKKTQDGDADLQQLAKEYVDLWESQIKAFTNDENLARTMAQTMELMNAGAANVAAMMQNAAQGAGDAGTGTRDGSKSDGAEHDGGNDGGDAGGGPGKGAGTPAAGAASGNPEPDVHELALRIAELERRLARLEGLAGPAGKVAPRKTE